MTLTYRGLRPHAELANPSGHGITVPPEILDATLAATPELLAASAPPAQMASWNVDAAPAVPAGVVAFHALSPLGDTAFLLASLGQVRRLACLVARPLTIVLCERDIARYNRVVSALGDAHLLSNWAFRRQIYEAIGAQVRPASLTNMPDVAAAELWERALWVHARQSDDDTARVGRQASPELRVRAELQACLRAHFHDTDRETALYFLAQRHHQHRYSDYLKLGNPRERRFDAAAHQLDVLEYGRARGVRSALYVPDYRLGRSGRTAVTMHAYCFPSGTAFERSKSIQYCRRICLHLEDLGNTQHARAAFLALCPPHDARFLADLLSFIHFYAVHQHRSTDPELTHALASADPEWAQSWDQYSVAPESFAQQTRQWFRAYRAGDAGSLRPPYHLYPWLLHGPRRRERLTAVALAATRWLARELPELRDFSGGRCALGLAEGEG